MTGHYKEISNNQYKLISEGYEQVTALDVGDCYDNPKGFNEPASLNGWKWRKAVKDFIRNDVFAQSILKNYEYKIIKGQGYWKDLQGLRL